MTAELEQAVAELKATMQRIEHKLDALSEIASHPLVAVNVALTEDEAAQQMDKVFNR